MPTTASNVQDIRDLIRDPDSDKDGNPITPRYSDAVIFRKMNFVSNAIARKTLCVKKVEAINTVAGTQEYTMPTDYIQLRLVTYTSSAGATPKILREVPLSETRAISTNTSVYGYARTEDNVLRLTGVPQTPVVGGLSVDYYAFPTPIAAIGDASEIPERYHDALIYGTASVMNLVDEEPGKAANLNALLDTAIEEVLNRESEASHTSPGRIRDAYDPWTGSYIVI